MANHRQQQAVLISAALAAAGLFVHLLSQDLRRASLVVIGIALGVTLYHAAFGFTGAYRRAIREGDLSGVTAQILMIAMATLLFAPTLASGQVFGHAVSGAVAPVSVSMALGALVFGIGMQFGGGCASGTLFSVGGGDLRMVVVLVFFCIGCFLATLHLSWWSGLPGIGPVSLAQEFGWWQAVGGQLIVLLSIYAALYRLGHRNKAPLWWATGFSAERLLRGPWPLVLGAVLLAVLNWLTLLVAGHPWSITWGFTLWAAKAATALGWDPSVSAFWGSGFPNRALLRPVLEDTTSVMNIGILIGAATAASLARRVQLFQKIPVLSLAAGVLGGILLGYGARLAYGCNIGAFFSGVASTSLHGWVWIAAAMIGNVIGVRLRPLFKLD